MITYATLLAVRWLLFVLEGGGAAEAVMFDFEFWVVTTVAEVGCGSCLVVVFVVLVLLPSVDFLELAIFEYS